MLITKLGSAEIRAMMHMSEDVKKCITPLIEITRGRKLSSRRKKVPEEWYPFDRYMDQIKAIWKGHDVLFDLTSTDSLSNAIIEGLYNSTNGYQNWCDFIERLNADNTFSSIIPCIVLDGEDDHIEDNLKLEVERLKNSHPVIAYRSSIDDEACYDDIPIVARALGSSSLLFIIDAEYVSQPSIYSFYDKIKKRIENITPLLPANTQIVVSSTSFPNNISEIGGPIHDEFELCEIKLHEMLKDKNIIYSDYGCINPQRNDGVVMARGWIPRIDVPLERSVFYYRQRRPSGTSAYNDTYKVVAANVVKDDDFPVSLRGNWGIEQIENCAKGANPSSQPNYWISVRMSIHVETQVRRIYNI